MSEPFLALKFPSGIEDLYFIRDKGIHVVTQEGSQDITRPLIDQVCMTSAYERDESRKQIIEKMEDEVSEFKSKYFDLCNAFSVLQTANKLYDDQIDEYKDIISEKDLEVQSKRKQINALNNRVSELSRSHHKNMQVIKDSPGQLVEIESLRSEIRLLKDKNYNLISSDTYLRGEIDRICKELDEEKNKIENKVVYWSPSNPKCTKNKWFKQDILKASSCLNSKNISLINNTCERDYNKYSLKTKRLILLLNGKLSSFLGNKIYFKLCNNSKSMCTSTRIKCEPKYKINRQFLELTCPAFGFTTDELVSQSQDVIDAIAANQSCLVKMYSHARHTTTNILSFLNFIKRTEVSLEGERQSKAK